jgi:hypothetical protein
MEKTVPGAEEDHDWEWKELCFFERLPNIGPLPEDENEDDGENDGGMDLDD